ncbi:hypothetical protein BGZ94_004639, partial [Podila epigama]
MEQPISVALSTPCPSTSPSELSLSSLAASALENDSDSEQQDYSKAYTLARDMPDLGYVSATGSTISLDAATKSLAIQQPDIVTCVGPSPPISPQTSTIQCSPTPTPTTTL